MFNLILLSVSVLLQSAIGRASSSTIVLDRQCWHEDVLQQVIFRSATIGLQEYAVKVQHGFGSVDKNHGPWSHEPICTEVLESINSKLCVYTDTSFSKGRGISIFTKPDLASRFVSLPPFRDSAHLEADHINAYSGTWRAAAIPNKGIGILATKDLRFKDRVTAYTPVFLAYLEDELPMLEREMWWRFALEQLPEKTRKDLYSLSYVYGDERVRAQDIVKANTFQVEVGGANHLAIFPETSRLNHACNPNAQYVIDTDLLTHTVHVTRPIKEGEEITISYTSPLAPTAQRQEHLQNGFHFTCTCPRCQNPDSDTALETITALQSHLNDWSPNSRGSPKLAEELLELYRQEGLEGFMDIPYGFAALAYNAAGNNKKAVSYAEKAKEAILMKDGKWVPNLKLWEELLRDVKEHWSYRRRVQS